MPRSMAGDAHGHGHGHAAEGAEKGLSHYFNSNSLFGRRNVSLSALSRMPWPLVTAQIVIAVAAVYATGFYLYSSSKKEAKPAH